ncbi:Piso0_001487 [Millerozyma farinosa CBS 7064]|uniref:Piso0_001487 protein n=1 Tax=Pichia sorbitophila (strain ATCC MYA-4447 / BCRC 22081 / CBS 7064 / NBRC 10061 / NRRL Y-12695) TaxID=559304 RepID=G8YKX5_PICSO|nr:Piso0_001487 [Millerozyma farinosa CBS 7064]
MKTCYYELLGVESDASDVDLKKAYRRKALQLHPDKNRDRIEEATEQFALIRAAYDVLSDPQERAWYDNHKSQILREDEAFDVEDVELVIPSISVDEILRHFNPSLYTRMDDSIHGFYKAAGRLFERLASEEVSHAKQQGLKDFSKYLDDSHDVDAIDESLLLYPRFGNSKSDYVSTVREFYNKWTSFSSVKTFNWKDEYRSSMAPDRKTRRLMEKENKRARDAARKDYNETVRNFVMFIKKRDPRVKKGVQDFEKLKKKKQQQEVEAQARSVRTENLKKLAQEKKFEIQDWQQFSLEELDEIEQMLHDEYSSSESDFDEFEDVGNNDHYECIVCNKYFKSEKQFASHEKSKKHIKAVKRLKRQMEREGIELGIDDQPKDEQESFATASSDLDSLDDDAHLDNDAAKISDPEIPGAENSEFNIPSPDLSKTASYEIDNDLSSLDASEAEESLLELKENAAPENIKTASVESSDENEVDRLAAEIAAYAKFSSDGNQLEASANFDDEWNDTKAKKKKSKSKKSGIKDGTSSNKDKASNGGKKEVCAKCKQTFTSRNQLFKHVDATGHAALKNAVNKRK